MALKEKFFAMLASLDEADKQRILAALATTPPDPSEATTPEVDTPAPSDTEETAENDAIAESPAQSADEPDQSTPDLEPTETDTDGGEPADAAGPAETPEATPATEPVPDDPPAPVQDTAGDDMPVDYQQIVDGLNAKILALEAENAALKAKTEGAFGLTSRPGEPVKVRSLYDDDTSDIHFKK